jgi:hypothetical protein
MDICILKRNIVVHRCMEATLRISLYSYFYLKLATILCLLIVSDVFSSTKLENKRAEQDLPRSEEVGRGQGVGGAGERGGTNNVYT